jgi:hypothetical protein
MKHSEQEILVGLEALAAELRVGHDQSAAALSDLVERRGELIGRLMQCRGLDAVARERMGDVLKTGMELERRLASCRTGMRLQLDALERGLRLLSGLKDGLSSAQSTVDLTG